MSSEIEMLIRELLAPPTRGHRYRPTPEQIERNRREIAIQRERDERARKLAYPDSSAADSTDTPDQLEKP